MPGRAGRRAGGRPAVAVVAAGLAALAALLGPAAAPALAHADLTRSAPRDGSTLERAPAQVVLRFDEPVQSTSAQVAVTAPDGSAVDVADVEVLDATVTASLDPLLLAGAYAVGWRVLSADGHPVDGELRFTLTDGAATSPGTPSTTQTSQAQPSAAEPSWMVAHGWQLGGGATVVGLGLLLWWRERRGGG